jgi:peptidoglycan/LPS O-acetylase OafA/YrhL
MISRYFWALSITSVFFAMTSVARPIIFFLLPHGCASYVVIKVVLLSILIFCAIKMKRGAQAVAASPRPKADSPSPAADPLLSLRALACLLVLLGHAFMVEFPPTDLKQMVQSNSPIWLLTASPWAGVWVFFTLSGYLMGKGFFSGRYTLHDSSIYQFLANRILRIVPIYYVATILVSILICPEIFKPNNLWMLFLILIFDYQGNFSINPIGALWSVSTEMQFYLLVPLLFLLLSLIARHAGKAIILAPLLICGLSEWTKSHFELKFDTYQYIYTPLTSNLDCFIIGMTANPIIQSLRHTRFVKIVSLGQGALLLGIFYVVIAYSSSAVAFDGAKLARFWIVAPSLTALVIAAAMIISELSPPALYAKGILGKLIANTQTFGVLTYCIYTWHAPVFISLRTIAPKSLSVLQSLGYGTIAIAFAALVAVIFYYSIELPFDKLKKSRAFHRLPSLDL